MLSDTRVLYSLEELCITRMATVNSVARAGEKARRQLYKNAASNIEQVLEHQLYGHLPPITKTFQVRPTRYAGHYWRCRDELTSDVLPWTPTYGRAKVGRPTRTYIQQLCEDTGCNPEDLPEAMNDREKWWTTVSDICVGGSTWWYIYMCVCVCVCTLHDEMLLM